MSDIPPITEIRRLRIEPGDKLVVRVSASRLDMAIAAQLRQVVRDTLGLADDFPVLVLARDASVEVVSS